MIRLPDFLCIGAQRGGTTTLQKLLDQHPAVFLPACKEVHYFSLHADQDPHWYADHFRDARPHQRCGDITPYYLFHPEAPGRIRRLLPEARLIVLLRDPVERAISQYFHSLDLDLEDLPLEQALEAEAGRLQGAEAALRQPDGRHRSHQEHSYLSRSRYGEQLERFEALYSAEQLLILRSEDLFGRPEALWHQLQNFLDLPEAAFPGNQPAANASSRRNRPVSPTTRLWLKERLSSTYLQLKSRYGLAWPDGLW